MFAAKHYPEQITGAELDLYLSKGWYRMGQTIFTTHFLCFGHSFYSAIWIRLDLEEYAFRKSLRKLLKKNDQQLDISFGPARIDPQREELYAIYREDFPGVIAPSILDSLQDGEHFNIYNTLEFTAHLGDELIALSYFDIGEDSVSSILGIYHPGYKDRSLGFYTMLKEIEYCIDHGIRYYYPGYIVPGYNRFDYKKRIGQVDYYRLDTGDWEPLDQLAEEDIPIALIQTKLKDLQLQMAQAGLESSLKFYPIFEANLFGYWGIPYLDYPLFLLCDFQQNTSEIPVIIFDPRTKLYQLMKCKDIEEFQFYFNEHFKSTFDSDLYFTRLIGVEQILISAPTEKEMVDTLQYAFG